MKNQTFDCNSEASSSLGSVKPIPKGSALGTTSIQNIEIPKLTDVHQSTWENNLAYIGSLIR